MSWMQVSNHLLAADVREELDWDRTLDASRIQVDANDGRITLRGAVKTFAEVRQAELDACAVRGVCAVDNEVQVGLGGEIVTDPVITLECLRALNSDPSVPRQAVAARVTDGWVTLTGQVSHHYERRAAEHAVAPVIGVLGISNKVELTREPIPSDVVHRIRSALQRKAIIENSPIAVSTMGDIVYLDGYAATWLAIRTAVDTAWRVRGVTQIVNRLSILP
jgi:osmotically-inducible protein OsmY